MLNIGVIGCGTIGRQHINRFTNLIPSTKVVACSDYFEPAAQEAATLYNIDKVYKTGQEVIADPNVDAVVITAIDSVHAEYVMESLKHKKYVFCEKPLAVSAKDAENIVAAEAEIGKKLVQVGFMRRYDPGYAEMKRIINSGEMGEPLIIHACHRNRDMGDDFETNMAITNVAIHELDVCRWLLDDEYASVKVQKVKQSGLSKNRKFDNPQIALMETTKGCQIDVEIQAADCYGYDIQCQVVCEKGTINLPNPSAVVTKTDAQCRVPILTFWGDRFVQAYDIELANWVEMVQKGNITGPNAWDGYAACVAGDALNASRGSNAFLDVKMIEKPSLYK